MNSLKPFLAAILLTLTIGIPALAGDVSTPTIKEPPPPATCSTCDDQSSTTSTESVEPGSTDLTNYEPVQTSELAVDMLLALLSIF